MRLVLAAVGRLKQGPERELVARYEGRAKAMTRSLGFAGFDLREVEEGHGGTAAERMSQEARSLSALVPAGALVVALDERGIALPSAGFASRLGAARDGGRPALLVAIGGPDGHDPAFRAGADLLISYGAATFPHGLVRVLAAEQIYRALTILAGHPYHRA